MPTTETIASPAAFQAAMAAKAASRSFSCHFGNFVKEFVLAARQTTFWA